jgi:hypothetical protein
MCVDVLIDGKRVGGNGTLLMVLVETTCKEVLSDFLQLHASDYHPLPATTVVTMFCQKTSGSTIQDCSLFLDYPVTLAMSEVLTKRFTFKCCRPAEDRPIHQDQVMAMMSHRNSADLSVPPVTSNTRKS